MSSEGMTTCAWKYFIIFDTTTIPVGARSFEAAMKTSVSLWFYGGLRFCFFLLMGLEKSAMAKFVSYYTLVVSICVIVPPDI